MFSQSSGLQFNGGNFYNVSGDVNLQTRQHLTLQDQQVHTEHIQPEWDAALTLTDGGQEGYGRELSGVSRNVRHDMSVRVTPYVPSPLDVHPSQHTLTPSPPMHNRSASSSNSQHHHVYQDSNISADTGDLYPPQHVPHHLENSLGGYIGYDLSRRRVGQIIQPIQGGTFITAENVNHRHGEDAINLLHRSVVLEALYDSADSFPQPRCHPETRKKILDDLYAWAISDNTIHSIRWLYGPAGSGKSAIMQSLCQRLLPDADRLGASFFFKRGHPTRGNAKVLFGTLAYQFAFRNRHWKAAISRSIEDDSTVVGRHMDVQLRKLIIGPSQCFADTAPSSPVLLIDGLDECENESAQVEILRLLRNTARDHPRQFRILIASRPEPHIREMFDDPSFSGLYDPTNVEQSFEDVRRYLCDEFSRIHREHRGTMDSIPTPWPLPEVLAETGQNHFRPTEQLELIQNPVPSDSESPLDTLDQLYTQILSSVPQRNRAKLCDVLCVPGDAQLILRCLHSVLDIPSDSLYSHWDVIHVHHASFFDFLRDPQRSSVFHVGPGSQYQQIGSLGSPGVSYQHDDREINRADNHVAWQLTHEPGWIHYLVSIPPSAELVPSLELVNPDFLWYRSNGERFDKNNVAQLIIWLKEIQPPPTDLIQRWEDYSFMGFYKSSHDELQTDLCLAWNETPPINNRPSLQALRMFRLKLNHPSDIPILELCREFLFRSPHFANCNLNNVLQVSFGAESPWGMGVAHQILSTVCATTGNGIRHPLMTPQESPDPSHQLISRWEEYLIESNNQLPDWDDWDMDNLERRWRDFSKEYPLKIWDMDLDFEDDLETEMSDAEDDKAA
ncbi:hypothetical protein B0H14DRAFT_2690933 [Mycena olivaceomarginata]|nr:hypothetical protein B0H14DRAFT_2690933 [Mycena olivaceomarginata]